MALRPIATNRQSQNTFHKKVNMSLQRRSCMKTRFLKYLVIIVAAAVYAGSMFNTAARPSTPANAPQTANETALPLVSLKRLGTTSFLNALLIMRVPNRQPGGQFRLNVTTGSLIFSDTGQSGDEVAGDGRFSSLTTVDFRALSQDQQAFAEDIASSGTTEKATTPVFDGRIVVGEQELIFPQTTQELQPGQEIILQPIWSRRRIDPARSLIIVDPKVVEDPLRTYNPCTGIGTPMGKWTFGYLMQEMANTPFTGIPASTFVRNWLAKWEAAQVVNGWNVPGRPSVKDTIITPWEAVSGGPVLDLSKAPFKLLAIVNRIDLAGNSGYQISSAGEARFVFGAIDRRSQDGCCRMTEMTVIFEYGIDRKGCPAVRAWAQQWVNLSTLVLGSAAYNAALEAITEQFAKRDVAPNKVNRSALNQLRTNEFLPPITAPWEMREFKLTPGRQDPFPAPGGPFPGASLLVQTTTKQTPDRVLNNTATLADFINNTCPPGHTVPLSYPRIPPDNLLPNDPQMLGGNAFIPPGVWNAAGITCPSVDNSRFEFSFATCGGCHLNETATSFYHIRPTGFGVPAALSLFLSGPLIVNDPISGTPRLFDELARRANILSSLARSLCPLPGIDVFVPLRSIGPVDLVPVRPDTFIH